MKSIPFYSSLINRGTTNEILLYGLIETLSIERGYCFASSDFMANLLGVKKETVRNLLSSIAKKEWVKVIVEGNKRVSITPLLETNLTKKEQKKPVEKSVEKPSRASFYNDSTVTVELRNRHSKMTQPSEIKQGSDNIFINNLYKENKTKESKNTAADFGSLEAKSSARPLRKNFSSDEEWEKAYYKWSYAKV